jgi:hypothetical protein
MSSWQPMILRNGERCSVSQWTQLGGIHRGWLGRPLRPELSLCPRCRRESRSCTPATTAPFTFSSPGSQQGRQLAQKYEQVAAEYRADMGSYKHAFAVSMQGRPLSDA